MCDNMEDSNYGNETRERANNGTSNDSVKVKKVTLIADEWLSKKGGLSTINRVLSTQLAKSKTLEVTLFMCECAEEEKKQAEECNVKIVESRMPSEEEWWKFPPTNFKTDFVIGHGAKLGKQAEYIRSKFECKWVQVVHTEPEELSSSKEYSGAGAKGEEKSKEEVRLCRNADMVVGMGPKLTEAYDAKLRPFIKVFELTPGIFKEFLEIEQAPSEGTNFRVLIFGRGDLEDTSLKGYDLAAKSIAELHESDKSIYLIFMGVRDQEHDQVRKSLKEHGPLAERLLIRSFCESRQELAETFREADLAIMPSKSEGFGLTALEALSAGLPILIGWNTGLAQALKKVPNGTSCIVKTDDPSDWTRVIKEARHKERKVRLEEARRLCEDYGKQYPWEAQCEKLVEEMLKLCGHGVRRAYDVSDVWMPVNPLVLEVKRKKRKKNHHCILATVQKGDPAEVSTSHHVITPPYQAPSSQLQGNDSEIGRQPPLSGCDSSQSKYKGGKPSDSQLLELSSRIASKWERIGLLLGLSQDQIDDIKINKDDKAFSMLLDWRNITTSHIPFKALYDALCHKTVRLNVVAREFCLRS